MAEQRGKLVILLMVLVAIAMSGYAWWHQRQSGRRSAGFWGTESAVCVRYAPRVEFVPLLPKTESTESGKPTQLICGSEYVVGEAVDVTRTHGLVHARHALVDDLSYDWNAPRTNDANWEFLLRFRDQDRVVMAAFDTERGLICFVNQSRINQFIPKIAAAFGQKRQEWQKLAQQAATAK